jgi:TatA/E family protein of Tat protein translocase
MVVALLIFGPKRLPELARSLGRGMAEFRRASSDLRQTLQEADPANDPVKPAPPAAPSIAPPVSAGSAAREATDEKELDGDSQHAEHADRASLEPEKVAATPGQPAASEQADAPPETEKPGAHGG